MIKLNKEYIKSDAETVNPTEVLLTLEDAAGVTEAVIKTIDEGLTLDDLSVDTERNKAEVTIGGTEDGEPVWIGVDLLELAVGERPPFDPLVDYDEELEKEIESSERYKLRGPIYCSVDDEVATEEDVQISLDGVSAIAESVIKVLDDGLTLDNLYVDTDEQTVNIEIGGTEDGEPVEITVDVSDFSEDEEEIEETIEEEDIDVSSSVRRINSKKYAVNLLSNLNKNKNKKRKFFS